MPDTCYDCKFYLPVDVFKGLCKVNKNKIMPEDRKCEKFEMAAKCKFCTYYTEVKEGLGFCKSEFDAYPDMPAAYCEDFLMSE